MILKHLKIVLIMLYVVITLKCIVKENKVLIIYLELPDLLFYKEADEFMLIPSQGLMKVLLLYILR